MPLGDMDEDAEMTSKGPLSTPGSSGLPHVLRGRFILDTPIVNRVWDALDYPLVHLFCKDSIFFFNILCEPEQFSIIKLTPGLHDYNAQIFTLSSVSDINYK